jgi:hypothetical protein
VNHIESTWDEPPLARHCRRLASFSRLMLFDKRGSGMSDRVPAWDKPTLEQRIRRSWRRRARRPDRVVDAFRFRPHLGAWHGHSRSPWCGLRAHRPDREPVRNAAALFAMKLHAIEDREPTSRPEKRSTDTLDLYACYTSSLRSDLASAPSPLRHAVRAATQRVSIDDATRI